MSTYIQGVDEYIPQIQQFQPDFNFFANALQYKQSKYDAAREQIADVYNSILNNPMIRQQDLDKREEFFKQIDNDIKKISRMDLSLRQNQVAASNVFSQLLDDKNIAHDMTFTKLSQNVLTQDENMRLVGDSRRWEGMQRLVGHYIENYKEASDQDALKMNAPKYIYKKDIGEDVAKLLEDGKLKFDVTEETPFIKKIDSKGNEVTEMSAWIVKRKNGELSESFLRNILLGKYANDAEVAEYYRAQQELKRLDFMKTHAEEYGSKQAAEQAYIQQILPVLDKEWKKKEDELNAQSKNQKSMIEDAKKQISSFQKANDEEAADSWLKKLEEYSQELEGITATKEYVSQTARQITNSNGQLSGDVLDRILAGNDMELDIYKGAKMASMQGYEESYSVNPYKLEEVRFNNELKKELMRENFEMEKMREKAKYDLQKEMIKQGYDPNNANIPHWSSVVLPGEGMEVSDEDYRGTLTTQYWDETLSRYLENNGMTSNEVYVLNDIIDKIRNKQDPNWAEMQAFVKIALSSLDDSEREKIYKDTGGDYKKLYEKVKNKSFNVSSLSAFTIDNIYNDISNDIKNFKITLSDESTEAKGRVESLNLSYNIVKQDMIRNLSSVLAKYDKDSDEYKALRAYANIGKDQSVDNWDGRLATFDQFVHNCQSYGITRADAVKLWDTKNENKNSVQNMWGKGYDNILPYTAYAQLSGIAKGADSRYGYGAFASVTNKLYDPHREQTTDFLEKAIYSNSVKIVEGYPSDNNGEDRKANQSEVASFLARLNNTQDSKSAAKENFSVIFMPVADNSQDRVGMIISDYGEKDQSKRKTYTITVDKKDLSGSILVALDKQSWAEELLYRTKEIPLRSFNENFAQNLRIGTDSRGQLYVNGIISIYNPDTKKMEKMNLNYDYFRKLGKTSPTDIILSLNELQREYLSKIQ